MIRFHAILAMAASPSQSGFMQSPANNVLCPFAALADMFFRMAATLTSILVHVTFSTKNRVPIIPLDLRPELFRYMGGVCRDMKSPLLHAGGVEDHVHLLVSLGKTVCVADLLMHAKRATSIWMKEQRPGLAEFAWQDGYFAFSIGHDSIDAVRHYLDAQLEHHHKVDFKQEVLGFLEKYHVEYDPKYLWD